jgi:hypothetical protein
VHISFLEKFFKPLINSEIRDQQRVIGKYNLMLISVKEYSKKFLEFKPRKGEIPGDCDPVPVHGLYPQILLKKIFVNNHHAKKQKNVFSCAKKQE